MKKTLFVLSILSAVVCQNFTFAADTRQELEKEIESLISGLQSAESDAEAQMIRKGFIKSNLKFLKSQAVKQIKRLEAQLAKCAEKLSKIKDGKKAQKLRTKMHDLSEKIKKLKDALLGNNESSHTSQDSML